MNRTTEMMGTSPKDTNYLSTTWFIACRSGNLSLVVTLLFSGDHFSNLSYLLNLQDENPHSPIPAFLLRDDPELAKDIAACIGSSFAGMTGLHIALAACFGKQRRQYDPEPFANRTTEKMFELRKQLVLQLIEVSSLSALEITFGNGNTALHLATLLGERDIVQALLRKGVLPCVENDMRLTPAQIARGEHADSIRDLIRAADASWSSSLMPSSPPSPAARHFQTTPSAGYTGRTTSPTTIPTTVQTNTSRLISAKRALDISPDKHMPSTSIAQHDASSAPESASKSVRLTPEDGADDGESISRQSSLVFSSPLSRTPSLLASDGLSENDGRKDDDEEMMTGNDGEKVEDVSRMGVKHISALATPSNFHQRVLFNNATSETSPSQNGGSLSPFHRLSISGQKSLSPPSPSLLRQAQQFKEFQENDSIENRNVVMESDDSK